MRKNVQDVVIAVEEYEQNRWVNDEWWNLAPTAEVVMFECVQELTTREPDHSNRKCVGVGASFIRQL